MCFIGSGNRSILHLNATLQDKVSLSKFAPIAMKRQLASGRKFENTSILFSERLARGWSFFLCELGLCQFADSFFQSVPQGSEARNNVLSHLQPVSGIRHTFAVCEIDSSKIREKLVQFSNFAPDQDARSLEDPPAAWREGSCRFEFVCSHFLALGFSTAQVNPVSWVPRFPGRSVSKRQSRELVGF